MTMPVAGDRRSRVIRRRQLQPSPVARPRQRRIEFFFDHRLDEAAHLARRPVSTGSNQLSKSFSSATSPAGFVVSVFMA
jgi:hypothetical protein